MPHNPDCGGLGDACGKMRTSPIEPPNSLAANLEFRTGCRVRPEREIPPLPACVLARGFAPRCSPCAILGVFAEFETNLRKERQAEGPVTRSVAPPGAALDHLPAASGYRRSVPWSVPGVDRRIVIGTSGREFGIRINAESCLSGGYSVSERPLCCATEDGFRPPRKVVDNRFYQY